MSFQLHKRRFKYKVLAQGWVSSSSLFHDRMGTALQGLGVVSYIDGIVVRGSTREEHNIHLDAVLKKLSEMQL